jgi:regulator of replication initiation timing
VNKNTYGNLADQLVEDIANLQFENAGLRVELERQAVCNGKGSEREAALLSKVEQLARKKAIQGLHLATMADAVLGENAEDRSDQTLVREVCRMARENVALRAYLKTGDMPDPQWSKDDIVHMYDLAIDERDAANESLAVLHRENAALRADKERLDWLQNSPYWPHPPLGEDIRAAIDAARKEKP